ncbi:magnesium transporter [Devosia sp.]|uniref:magnesium transporter n=1 Tax=Devosia sp. TaxID=1871048 RepID=UPI00326326B4
MTVDTAPTPEDDTGFDPNGVRDEDGHINQIWLDTLRDHLANEASADIIEMMAELHPADMGDVLEALGRGERLALVQTLGDRFDYSALTEVDESVRIDLMELLPNADIARGVSGLDNDDAVSILEDMEQVDRDEVLSALPTFERLNLRRSLDFPDESAGRRMSTDFIAIPPFWTVGQTIDYLRKERDLPEEFYQIYVVDASYTVLGTIPLDKFLRSSRQTKNEAIMNTNVLLVDANVDQEEAARDFERYDLIEVGVVDEGKRLVGVLTIDDMVDVIHEEATEDIRLLAGVGDEEISDSVWDALKSRSTWLFVNLLTAILASSVIGLFDVTIDKMVALAVLMPIVASMGGNAGTQTMTITVRALAMRELDRRKINRLVFREVMVGLLNGLIFAVIMGVIAALWFRNTGLGAVIGMALIVNLFAAGLAGILIPLGLARLDIDPAVASSAFVTTVTDVVGFFAFLGLAGLWFHLF